MGFGLQPWLECSVKTEAQADVLFTFIIYKVFH